MNAAPFPAWAGAVGALLLALAVGLGAHFLRSPRRRAPPPLPDVWGLTPRLVFSNDERRVHRLLREALPHQVVLPKLPLLRFCQPVEPGDKRYWYELLGSIHVGFAICSANGRVLAAIDLETGQPTSRRTLQIKEAVLAACQVRHLRCAAHDLPSAAELQLLVPNPASAARAPQSADAAELHPARDALASTFAAHRAERTAPSNDSTIFHDSFFAPDTRPDAFAPSRFAAPPEPAGGVVVDPMPSAPTARR